MKEKRFSFAVIAQVGIIFCILIDIAVGKNQSSISNNVERPSRSLESILEGLTALDPLAASFGAPTSLTPPSEAELLDGSLQDKYPEQHPVDLKVSRRPLSSSSPYTSYTSSRSEIDLFDKETVSHQPSSNKYQHPSQGNHHRSHTGGDSRQKAQDELFANFPVLPYPPAFLPQMPPSSPNHHYNHNQTPKTSVEGRKHQDESAYQNPLRGQQDRYPDNDLLDLDYHNNTYSPSSSLRNQPSYENENFEGHHHHTSLSRDESTPFYPSHGIQTPHEVRHPIYSYGNNNKNYAASTSSSTKSPTREPYYYHNPSNSADNRPFNTIKHYGGSTKQEVSHVPNNENHEGLEIIPGLHFRGYHRHMGSSNSGGSTGSSSLSSPTSSGHYLSPQEYPEDIDHRYKPGRNSGNNNGRVPYYNREHDSQPVNHLTHGEQRPVVNYGLLHQDTQAGYGVRDNYPPSLDGSTSQQLHNNYSPNHGYSGGPNVHFNFEGDRNSGSTGGHHQTLGSYPVYAYPVASASNGQGHPHLSQGYGYGQSVPGRVNDFKAHETAVNAAALQALQSIQGLDRYASYSFTGLPSTSSTYGSLGTSLSGLYR